MGWVEWETTDETALKVAIAPCPVRTIIFNAFSRLWETLYI